MQEGSNWNIFPNTNCLAYYSPIGNYIQLNEIELKQYQDIIKNPDIFTEKISIIEHETQHWIDHISTLWGIQTFFKIFKSFHVTLYKDEQKLFEIKELYDKFNRDSIQEYYLEFYNTSQVITPTTRWSYLFSTGARFDNFGKPNENTPILFLKFFSSDDKPISRVPLTVASLLETTAMYAEMESRLTHISNIVDDCKRKVASILYEKELFSLLYNNKLTLYSVAVHTASNILKINDISLGFKVSSSIATVCLNLSSKHIKQIKIPEKSIKSWENRPNNFINNEDRGFIYYCLCLNYSDKYGVYDSKTFTIDNLLKSSNLPSTIEIEKEIEEEISKLTFNLLKQSNIFINLFGDKVATGSKIRKKRGIGLENGLQHIDENEYRECPYFMFADTYFEYDELDINDIVTDLMNLNITREQWWKLFNSCQVYMDRFTNICGV